MKEYYIECIITQNLNSEDASLTKKTKKSSSKESPYKILKESNATFEKLLK